MSYPTVGNSGSAAVAHTSPTSPATVSSFSVNSGDSIYVFVGYAAKVGANSAVVTSVTDSVNTFKLATRIQNTTTSLYPALEIWYADNVPANVSETIKVYFSNNTFFTICAVQIVGANPGGSLDVVTQGTTGASLWAPSAPASEDPITTVNQSDLVISCVCFARGVGALGSGGGFTVSSVIDVLGPAGPGDCGIQGFTENASTSSSYDARAYCANSGFPYAVATVAIRQAFGVSQWSGLAGRPFVVVSPAGVKNGLSPIANDGADFGVDTPFTTTGGIQEAIDSLPMGGRVLLIPGTYTLANSVILPGEYGISLESYSNLEVGEGSSSSLPNACLNYTGGSAGSFAIDSSNVSLTPGYQGPASNQSVIGYIDGIVVNSPNWNGVRINNVVYHIGRLSVYGTNNAANNTGGNAVGLQLSPVTNGSEVNIGFVRVIGFLTEIIFAQDHISVGHINTSNCSNGGTVMQWGNGGNNRGPLGLSIMYWHHAEVNTPTAYTPAYIIDCQNSGNTGITQPHAGFIGSLFLEVPTTVPTAAIVRSSSGFGYNLVIANLDWGAGGFVNKALLESPTTTPPYNYAKAVPGVNVLNVDNATPMGFTVSNLPVPTSTTPQPNTAGRPVFLIILTVNSGATATITDSNGVVSPAFALLPGAFVYLAYGASITPTWTTLTWKAFGV